MKDKNPEVGTGAMLNYLYAERCNVNWGLKCLLDDEGSSDELIEALKKDLLVIDAIVKLIKSKNV